MLKEEFEHFFQLLEQGKTIAGKSDAFSSDLNRLQTNLLLQVGGRMVDPNIEKGTVALSRVLGKFQGEVKQLVTQFLAGESSQVVLKNFKEVAFKRYKEAFLLGAKASGNPFYKADVPLTDKDLSFLKGAVNKEATFFNRLLRDAKLQIQTGTLNKAKINRRADMYGDAAKAQFWNGTVKGMGDNVEIHWVLGQAEHCSDCPILASKTYTWETLPTTPGAGDTACLSNCKCHLEIIKRPPATEWGQGTTQTETPTWSNIGLGARWCSVVNQIGQEMSGGIVDEFAGLWKRLYQARQMVTLSTSLEQKQAWVEIRRVLNNEIIELAKARGVRTLPSVSVSKLVATAKSAINTGARFYIPSEAYVSGMEVVFIRGDFWTPGILSKRGNTWEVKNAQGQTFVVDDASDIIMGFRPATLVPSEYYKTAPYPAEATETFPTIDYVNEYTWQGKKLVDLKAPPSKRELDAAEKYCTTPTFRTINNSLRGKKIKLSPSEVAEVEKYTQALTALIKKSKVTKSIKCFRGIGFDSQANFLNFVKNIKKGSTFSDKGFSSVSVSPNVAATFSVVHHYSITLRINLPAGSSAFMPAEIPYLKELIPREYELILPPSTRFKVLNITPVVGGTNVILDVEVIP